MLISKKTKGFTLIEVLIVVMIIGLLAAIAGPSYLQNVRKGRRADVRTVLVQNAQFMERSMTENSRYDITPSGPTTLPLLVSPVGASAANVDYDIALTVLTPLTYTITATRKAGGKMDTDECGNYTLTQTGARGLVAGTFTLTVDECWTK